VDRASKTFITVKPNKSMDTKFEVQIPKFPVYFSLKFDLPYATYYY